VISVSEYLDGKPVTKTFPVQNEPKSGKKKGSKPGTIRVTLHYPEGQTAPQPAPGGQAAQPVVEAKPKSIQDTYAIGEVLGQGGFSIVKKAIHKQTQQPWAIKIIKKDEPNLTPQEIENLYSEIDIMQKLKHSNIVALNEVFEDKTTLYLVLELIDGGELFDQIIAKGSYPENEAATIIKQVLQAVGYMHTYGVAHRDLKPENLLCCGPDKLTIKVSDFGLSKDFGRGQLKTSCGTPDYVAPEVLSGKGHYDHSVDIWSIGVILYVLICGFPPFFGNDEQEIFRKIVKCSFSYPAPDWTGKSDEVKQLISAILTTNVNARPTAKDALESPWILKYAPK